MSIRDEMVRCPFDENHRVSRARFPVHLIKCRKQHKNKDFSICPYNATHYILTPEFKFHLDNCPDKKEKDLAAPLYDDRPSSHVKDIVVPPPSEIWGNDDEEVISYLDVKDKLIEKLPILRTPCGLTKSERKRFVRREIHRFHTLAREQRASTSRESVNEENWDEEEREMREEGKLEKLEEEREMREEGKLEKLEEEQEEDYSDNDKAAGKKAAGKEAQGYEAEDDEDRGAVGGKQDSDGQFSVVKRKKKKKKNSMKREVEENGGKSSSDKNKSHRPKHH